jgi:hypothetical protein
MHGLWRLFVVDESHHRARAGSGTLFALGKRFGFASAASGISAF